VGKGGEEGREFIVEGLRTGCESLESRMWKTRSECERRDQNVEDLRTECERLKKDSERHENVIWKFSKGLRMWSDSLCTNDGIERQGRKHQSENVQDLNKCVCFLCNFEKALLIESICCCCFIYLLMINHSFYASCCFSIS